MQKAHFLPLLTWNLRLFTVAVFVEMLLREFFISQFVVKHQVLPFNQEKLPVIVLSLQFSTLEVCSFGFITYRSFHAPDWTDKMRLLDHIHLSCLAQNNDVVWSYNMVGCMIVALMTGYVCHTAIIVHICAYSYYFMLPSQTLAKTRKYQDAAGGRFEEWWGPLSLRGSGTAFRLLYPNVLNMIYVCIYV